MRPGDQRIGSPAKAALPFAGSFFGQGSEAD